MSRFVVLHIRERMPVSRASPASQASSPPRRAAVHRSEVIAVEGAAGSGTASAKSARVGCSRQLPGRSAEAGPGAATPGLAGGPELAAAADGGGIDAVLGLDDPAGPGGDSGAVKTAGPARIGRARSDSALGEPCAGREAVGEPEPGTGQGGVAAAAGRPPEA